MEIVLASQSPRRRELMARVTPEFRVFPVDVDESSVPETDPVKFAGAAAVLKAKTAAASFPEAIVIGADTVVALRGRILGKPRDRAEARAMLESLSGQRHRVITGLAFYRQDADRLLAGYDLTYVTFRRLTDEMIDGYLDQNDFLDKAGAYAVQDVGDAFVARIKGDYNNVVGFPVKKVASMLARFKAEPLTVEVADVDFPGNDGLAHRSGRTVLIPGAVVGEVLTVQVVGESRGRDKAEVIRVERPSPFRVEPACPHFGVCGGCLYQSTAYPEQLAVKRRALERELTAAGVVTPETPPVRPVEPSPSVYGYRNKMEFGFGENWGGLVLGLRERNPRFRKGQSRTFAVERCPIFGAEVEAVFPDVMEFARAQGLRAFNTVSGQGELRHLVLRAGRRTGELMVLLVSSGAETDFGPLAARLAAEVPGLRSFYHVVNKGVSDFVDFADTRLLAGRPWIEERLAGRRFRIRPETFFQTNTEAAELLYGRIPELAGLSGRERVLGLYCGSGAIELSIAGAASEVTGIDALAANITAAEENRAENGIANARFAAGTVEDLLKDPPADRPDVLILDPPRPGLSPRAMKNVLGLRVPKVVYVSCNPASLARDLGQFISHRYEVKELAPFDFFPHTPHLETVAILCR